MEARLEKRYEQLVRSHMNTHTEISAGVKSCLSKETAFSQTQAAWRFFNNPNCDLNSLSEPLLKAGYDLSDQECESYCLIAHDWSHLAYNKHTNKQDRYNTLKKCVGYELQTSLLLSDQHGGPLSPLVVGLKTEKELIINYGQPSRNITKLDELAKRINWIEDLPLKKRCVHIIDREADSVALYRALKGHYWLVRANEKNTAFFGEEKKSIKKAAAQLSFTESRSINYKGIVAKQLIGETRLCIRRAAQPARKDKNGKRLPLVPGEPVNARLVVSKVVDESGKELALWYLLSSVEDVPASTLALWYYWRWSIESFFKLLKSAGMQLERWQQKTPLAIERRLLVASMACVCVWRIANKKGPEAKELRKLLVRLSGRQMKWKVEFTHNALLAGLWVLIKMQQFFDEFGPDGIRQLKQKLENMIYV